MLLSNCAEGQVVLIKSVSAENITKKRLKLLGFFEGEKINVAKNNNGSVLVIVSGKMLALGKVITSGVEVVCV